MTGKQTVVIGSIIIGLSLIVYFTDFNSAEKKRINEEYKAKEEKKKETQLKLKEIEKLQAEQKKTKGFHCLSAWDGSYGPLVQVIKNQMRDPSSFQHRETTITPNSNNAHLVYMKYGGKNAFGGYTVEAAAARIDTNCNLLEAYNQKMEKIK